MTTRPYLPGNFDSVEWVGPEDYAYAVSGLIHCVHLPETADFTKPAPVVVMLHGRGGNESVTWLFKQALPDTVAIVTPRAPLEEEEGGYGWFRRDRDEGLNPEPDTHEAALATLKKFLTSLARLYPVDPERLLLLGFSQGGAIGANLVLTQPALVIGLVSLAGFVPDLPASATAVDSLAGLPVFIAHGTRDEVIPLGEGRRARDLFAERGAQVTYGEYEVGHKMTMEGLKDLKKWIAQVMTKGE